MEFLGPFFPKYGSILLILWLEVVSYRTKTVSEQSSKIFCWSRKLAYPKFTVLVHFWAQCWWKNVYCSSVKTCVIPILVSYISRCFFHFFKNWIFQVVLGGLKGKKQSEMTKNSVCHTWYLRNHTSYECHLWCTCVKW